MATELLAAGSTVAASADFTLASGEETTLGLSNLVGGTVPCVVIELRDPAGGYSAVGDLFGGPQVVAAAGTYRVRRLSGTCSVYRG